MSSHTHRSSCASAAAVVAVLSLASPAWCEPITFLNGDGPDRFQWGFALTQDTAQVLNVTKPFDQQQPIGADFHTGEGFWLFRGENFAGDFVFGRIAHTNVGESTLAGVASLDRITPINFSVGDIVRPLPNYGRITWVNTHIFGSGRSFVFQNTPIFLGLSMMRSGETGLHRHFGWVGVVWSEADRSLDVFAWGFETTPYEPITIPDISLAAVPSPGTAIGLVGFLAIRASRRRRPCCR